MPRFIIQKGVLARTYCEMTEVLYSTYATFGLLRRLDRHAHELTRAAERISASLIGDVAGAPEVGEDPPLVRELKLYRTSVKDILRAGSMLTRAEKTVERLISVASLQKELASEAASTEYSHSDRLVLDTEAALLTDDFNRIIAALREPADHGTAPDLTPHDGTRQLQSDLLHAGVDLTSTLAAQDSVVYVEQLMMRLGCASGDLGTARVALASAMTAVCALATMVDAVHGAVRAYMDSTDERLRILADAVQTLITETRADLEQLCAIVSLPDSAIN